MKRKVTKILECLDIKTDCWGDIESDKLNRIERVIEVLAGELGYSVNFYNESIKEVK